MDLARAIGCNDDHGRCDRPDGTDLGDGDLEVGQELEEVGLELLIGAIQFIDEQDRTST